MSQESKSKEEKGKVKVNKFLIGEGGNELGRKKEGCEI